MILVGTFKSLNWFDDRNWIYRTDWVNWKEHSDQTQIQFKQCENHKQHQCFMRKQNTDKKFWQKYKKWLLRWCLKKSNNEPDDRNWVFLSDWLNWKEQHLKECETHKHC
jgi:hypothetical protein